MKRIFLDTDVIIDFISDREPFSKEASVIFCLIDQNKIAGYTSSLCFSNLYYVLTRFSSHEKVISKLRELFDILEVLSVDSKIISEALYSGFKDFEDAIQSFTAMEQDHMDVLITRNIKDYKKSSIPVMSPDQFLRTCFQTRERK